MQKIFGAGTRWGQEHCGPGRGGPGGLVDRNHGGGGSDVRIEKAHGPQGNVGPQKQTSAIDVFGGRRAGFGRPIKGQPGPAGRETRLEPAGPGRLTDSGGGGGTGGLSRTGKAADGPGDQGAGDWKL